MVIPDSEPTQLPDDVDDVMFVIAHAYGLASPASWQPRRMVLAHGA